MKVTKQIVSRLLSKWRRLMDIDHKWEIAINVYASEEDTPEKFRDSEAWIDTVEDVFYATLNVNAWQINSAEQLDQAICHETTHIVMGHLESIMLSAFGAQFTTFGTTILEQAIEHISRAMVRLQNTK